MIRLAPNRPSTPSRGDFVSRFLAALQGLKSDNATERQVAEQERTQLVRALAGNEAEIRDYAAQERIFNNLGSVMGLTRSKAVQLGGAVNEVLAMTPEPIGKAMGSVSQAVGNTIGGTIGGILRGSWIGFVNVFKKK